MGTLVWFALFVDRIDMFLQNFTSGEFCFTQAALERLEFLVDGADVCVDVLTAGKFRLTMWTAEFFDIFMNVETEIGCYACSKAPASTHHRYLNPGNFIMYYMAVKARKLCIA